MFHVGLGMKLCPKMGTLYTEISLEALIDSAISSSKCVIVFIVLADM